MSLLRRILTRPARGTATSSAFPRPSAPALAYQRQHHWWRAPYRETGWGTCADAGAQALVEAAAHRGDITFHPGPQFTGAGLTHPAGTDGAFPWVDTSPTATLAAAAAAWFTGRHPTGLAGDAAVDAAWDAVPNFFADRYNLRPDQLPGPGMFAPASLVEGPASIASHLYARARTGIEDALGVALLDTGDL